MARKLKILAAQAGVFAFVLLLALWGFSYHHSLSLQWQSRRYDGSVRIDYEASLSVGRGVLRPHLNLVRESIGTAQPDAETYAGYLVGRPFDEPRPHFIGNFLGVDAWCWTWHKPLQSIYNFDFWLPGWLLLIPSSVIACKVRRSIIRHHRLKRGQCPVCGYDLRASSGRCPECGAAIPKAVVG